LFFVSPMACEGSAFVCAVWKVLIFSGCNSHPATGSLQPVAIEATRGGNETVGAFETDGSLGDSASRQAVTRVNVEQASKRPMWTPTLH
jgi:hypothetical protein